MKNCNLYFLSCAPDGGIYHYRWTEENFVFVNMIPLDRPMYMVKEGNNIHVLLLAPFESNDNSGLVTLRLDENGNISEKHESPVSTMGREACHICCFQHALYVTNYMSGSVYASSGKLNVHEGCGSDPERQDRPHTHCIIPSPDGKCLVSTDLGLDRLFIYDTDLNILETADVPHGHGPRHLAFSENGRYLFCVNELRSTVSLFRYENGHIAYVSTTEALPAPDGKSFAAAIRVRGNRVYISHRGADSISCLELDGEELRFRFMSSCGGMWPRDFFIQDDFMFCTNEHSNSVSVLRLHEDELCDTQIRIAVKRPLCVLAAM